MKDSFYPNTDPDSPFLPAYIYHLPPERSDVEIPCRVSDPSAIVTLVNVDTNQPVPCMYDSKQGALGTFSAGTYVCKAIINGEVHTSEEYIVQDSIGACLRVFELVSYIYCF